jgi:ABC-type phosphate/phosphonate transport system substrate-binding protein
MLRPWIVVTCCAILLGVIAARKPVSALEPDPPPIRIGVLPTMFRGDKIAMTAAIKNPLQLEVEAQTGLECQLVLMLGLDDLRKQLGNGRVQFGLCHGFEFAWMKLKEPKLKPVMIASPVHRPLKVHVVVASASPATNLSDLKGKVLAIPNGSHATVTLFADRKCRCEGQAPSQYFQTITTPVNAETALHQVYDDEVQATIVDGAALQAFAERYPARSKLIRTIMESEPFPMSVVVSRDGAVGSWVLHRFQIGMKTARSSVMGRQLMGLLHSAGFEAVPPSYDKQLAEFVERYPPQDQRGD